MVKRSSTEVRCYRCQGSCHVPRSMFQPILQRGRGIDISVGHSEAVMLNSSLSSPLAINSYNHRFKTITKDNSIWQSSLSSEILESILGKDSVSSVMSLYCLWMSIALAIHVTFCLRSKLDYMIAKEEVDDIVE
ncbi:hypothetical protein RJT34_32607 [Clitoria ternatea]|uniref:Uncharacterized protein n=1 Tax=Clitoria ternatea TaxID=43366 RepID=A0AAN9EWC6_CLITE